MLITVILYGLLPLVLLLALRRKVVKEVQYLEPFIWFVGLGSIYELVGTVILKINSDYWLRFNKIAAFFLIAYFFFHLLKKKFIFLHYFFAITYLIFYFSLFLVWNEWSNLLTNSYLIAFQTLVVVVFSILWFRNLFTELYFESLLQNPSFYFISGLILYYSGTIFLFLASNVIYKSDRPFFADYWQINFFFNFILRTLLIFGIWKGRVK